MLLESPPDSLDDRFALTANGQRLAALEGVEVELSTGVIPAERAGPVESAWCATRRRGGWSGSRGGLALALTVPGFNLLGDALDPRHLER